MIVAGLAFYVSAAIYAVRATGLPLLLIASLLGILTFGFQARFWWRYERTPPFVRIKDDSIEYRLFGTAEVETCPLAQIQRVNFAGGNAIFNLPDEKQVQVPYTRRSFELTQEAKSKLASWAKAHGIEVVG